MRSRKRPKGHADDSPLSPSRRSLLLTASTAILSVGFGAIARAKKLSLKVTYYDDFAPYSFKNPDGSAAGIYVDCLNELLGRQHGVTLTHHAMPWARAQQDVKDGLADAFVTSPSDARKEYVTFNREMILQQDRVVVFAKDNPKADRIRKIASEEDLKQFSIGTYYGDARLNTLFKGMNVDLAPDIKQAYLKIATGRVDITVTDTSIWKYQTRSLDIRNKLDSVRLSDAPPTFIGIRKNHEAVNEILELFDKTLIEAKKNGVIERIIAKYIGSE